MTGEPTITVMLECPHCGDLNEYPLGLTVGSGCELCYRDWFGSREEAPKVKAVSVVVENTPPLVWPAEGRKP